MFYNYVGIEYVLICDSRCKKLLEIKIDKKPFSEPYVESICEKAGQKRNALSYTVFLLKCEQ